MDIPERLTVLLEREKEALAASEKELAQLYAGLPKKIVQVAELSGWTPDEVIDCCVRAAWQYKDFPWYGVLDVTSCFFLAKKQLEAKRRKK